MGEVAGVAAQVGEPVDDGVEMVAVDADVAEHGVVQCFGGTADGAAARTGDVGECRSAVGGMRATLDETVGLEAIDRVGNAGGVDLEALADLAEGELAAP